MSLHHQPHYLRSHSDKPEHQSSTSDSSPSPLTPPMDIIQTHNTQSHTTNTQSNRKLRPRNRRKRRFSQINDTFNNNENEDIDLQIKTPIKSNKKSKLSRKIKFTLNCEPVISRECSLSANSPVILNKKRKKYERIENYEIPISNYRMTRRNPYICCYSFFDGYTIGITPTLGAGQDLKAAIKIFSQDLVTGRAKASIQTQKNACLVYIKTRKNKLIGCGILHIDHIWKRVNIEMFAVDNQWRGNGFASMMVFCIQYRMLYLDKYDLFVCAANDAIPFWCNKKYNFLYAHKGILEQHEVEDEKHGNTKHLIWYGTPIQARCALLKCFKQTD